MNQSLYFRISNCVSFALGRKEQINGLTADEVYSNIQRLLHNDRNSIVIKTIENGDEIRRRRIKELIRDTFKFIPVKLMSTEEQDFFRNLLSGLPEAVLRVIDADKDSIAYTPEKNLTSVHPDKLLGLTDDACRAYKASIGARRSNYRQLFIALGEEGLKLQSDTLRMLSVRQVLCHEAIHTVFNSEPAGTIPELRGRLDYEGKFIAAKKNGQPTEKGEILKLKDKIYKLFENLSPVDWELLTQRKRSTLFELYTEEELALVSQGQFVTLRNRNITYSINPFEIHDRFDYPLKPMHYSYNDAMEEALASLFGISCTEPQLLAGDEPVFVKLREIASRTMKVVEEVADKMMEKERLSSTFRLQSFSQSRQSPVVARADLPSH